MIGCIKSISPHCTTHHLASKAILHVTKPPSCGAQVNLIGFSSKLSLVLLHWVTRIALYTKEFFLYNKTILLRRVTILIYLSLCCKEQRTVPRNVDRVRIDGQVRTIRSSTYKSDSKNIFPSNQAPCRKGRIGRIRASRTWCARGRFFACGRWQVKYSLTQTNKSMHYICT